MRNHQGARSPRRSLERGMRKIDPNGFADPQSLRAALREIETSEIENAEDAADRVDVAVSYLDDGTDNKKSTLPEDRSILSILRSVSRYLRG